MKKLDSLVDFFVEGRTNDTVSTKDKKLLKEALVNEVLQEVKADLTQAEKDALKKSLGVGIGVLRWAVVSLIFLAILVIVFLFVKMGIQFVKKSDTDDM